MLFFSVSGWGQQNQYGQTIIIPNYPTNQPIYYQVSPNEIWSDTAYEVRCDIVIENVLPGVTTDFKIIPHPNGTKGVNLYMKQGTKINIIDGSFKALGTATRRIRITGINPSISSNGSSWGGIIFNETPNNNYSEINNCIIEHIEKTGPKSCGASEIIDGAIFLYKFNNITIQNCIIKDNQIMKRGGAIFIGSDDKVTLLPGYPIIENNEIYNNESLRGAGICLFLYAYAYINNNSIHDNKANDSGGGIALYLNSEAHITNNSIIENVAKSIHHLDAYGNLILKPPVSGGGGIAIGQNSNAYIYNNEILNNTTEHINYPPVSNLSTGIGGGILIRMGSSATIKDNFITSNAAYDGGGLALYDREYGGYLGGPSYVTSVRNVIDNNSATNNGGGVLIHHSSGLFEFNTINDNYSNLIGGGVFVNSTTINNSTFVNNTLKFYNNKFFYNNANNGAGLHISGEFSQTQYITKVDLINNLIHHNRSQINAAGILLKSNIELNFHNNTLVQNYTTYGQDMGDGIYIDYPAVNNILSFINNIIFYNGVEPEHCQIYHPNVIPNEFQYNDIVNLGCQVPIGSNFDIPPDFVNPFSDFHLNGGAPVDLGLNSVYPVANTDLDFNNRFVNNIDIGAYEYKPNNARKAKCDTTAKSRILLYPNPTKNVIYISSKKEKISHVGIYSSDGRLVFSRTYANKNIIIDVLTLNEGIFIIKVQTENSFEYQKFIKND